jgi:hypothetical protein
VTDIGPLLERIDGRGPVCVLTSWTLGWMGPEQREGFVGELVRAGTGRPIAWLNLDHPGAVRGIEATAPTSTFSTVPSLVGLTIFGRDGIESQHPLAHVHPHGSALEWIPSSSA